MKGNTKRLDETHLGITLGLTWIASCRKLRASNSERCALIHVLQSSNPYVEHKSMFAWLGLQTYIKLQEIWQSSIWYFPGSLGRMTHRPSVPGIIFLRNFFKIPCKIIFLFFYNFMSFECHKSIKNYEKNNAWSIRCLLDESFVPVHCSDPARQRARISYWRLSDLKI